MSKPESRARSPVLTAAGLLVKVAASLGLLWLATRGLDVAAAFAVMKSRSVLDVAAAVALLLTAVALTGVRWHGLLKAHGARVGLRDAVLLTVMGQMFNAALPSTVGSDAARMYYAVGGGGALGPVTLATFLDRFVGLATIATMALVVALFEPAGLIFPPLWWTVVLALTAGIPAGLAVLFIANVSLDHPRVGAWLNRYAAPLHRQVGSLRVRFGALLAGAAWSAAPILLIGLALGFLSGDGGLGVVQGLAIAAPVILATSLPISIAGWGVREVVVVQIYAILGLPAEAGLATSLLFGFALLLLAVAGLPIWLSMRRRALRENLGDHSASKVARALP